MKQALALAFLIFIFVVNGENYDNSISLFDDDTPKNTNITCFCTGDENCDGNSSTCRITHPDHACYEVWSKYPGEEIIHITAGYENNE